MKEGSSDSQATQWRTVFLFGGVTAFLSLAAVVFDIVFGSITSGNLLQLPVAASDRFLEFSNSALLGLYHLDLLNLLVALLMLPTYFALVGVHRDGNLVPAVFAALLYFFGTVILVSTNAALPMLELSGKYLASTDDAKRQLFAAAGEALLSRGAHGSPGNLFGFVISELAGIGISLVMLRGGRFGRVLPSLGAIGGALLLVYTILVTFVSSVETVAVIIAAPGGLLSLAWMAGVALVLMREWQSEKD